MELTYFEELNIPFKKYQSIDYEKLKELIKDKKKVLIIAPRRLGKTRFIVEEVTSNDIVLVLTSRYRSVFIDNVKELKNFTPTVYSTAHDFATGNMLLPVETIFVDECFYIPEHIQGIIKFGLQAKKIICICSKHNDYPDEKIDDYRKNGFEIINAPLKFY